MSEPLKHSLILFIQKHRFRNKWRSIFMSKLLNHSQLICSGMKKMTLSESLRHSLIHFFNTLFFLELTSDILWVSHWIIHKKIVQNSDFLRNEANDSYEWVTDAFTHPVHSAVFFFGNSFVGKASNQQCCDIVTKY